MPTTDTTIQSLILSELQALRADYSEFSRATGERLSALEMGMKSLVGNGRPGKIAELESDIRSLQRWKYWLMGASTAAAVVVSEIWHLAEFIH